VYFFIFNDGKEHLLDYLCDCYNRVNEHGKGIFIEDLEFIQKSILEKAKEIFQHPLDYYTVPATPNGILPSINDCYIMLKNQGISSSITFFSEILNLLLELSDGKETFKSLVLVIRQSIIENMSKLKIEDDFIRWSEQLDVLRALIQNKEAAKIFMEMELAGTNVFPMMIELTTVLGNILRYTFLPINSEYAIKYFRNNIISHYGIGDSLRRNRESLTNSLDMYQERVKSIINKLYKEHGLHEIIDWFTIVANKNIDRLKMMHGQNVSTTGFMLNCLQCLLNIGHFYTKDYDNYLKICKCINPNFVKQKKIDYSKCELINKAQIMQEEKKDEEQKINFNNSNKEIEELFFLTHFYMELCCKEIFEFIKQFSMKFDRTKDTEILNIIYSFFVHLFSPSFMLVLGDFLSLTTCFLLYQIKPVECSLQDYLLKNYDLNISKAAPLNLSILPEHIISNIHEIYTFYMSHPEDDFFKSCQVLLPLLSKFYLTFLDMPYLQNLHLRGRLTEFYELLLHERESKNTKEMIYVIEEDKLFQNHILETIIKTFSFVEKTGANTQFYDKFQYRRTLLQLLKFIWKNPEIKAQWKKLWEISGKEHGILFANFLLNDFTHVNNEIITKLKEIKETEEKLAVDELKKTMTFEERQQSEELLKNNERYVKMFINFLNLMMNAIADLTEITPEMYTSEDLIEHFTTSLNYYLKYLITKDSPIYVFFLIIRT